MTVGQVNLIRYACREAYWLALAERRELCMLPRRIGLPEKVYHHPLL